MWALTKKEQRFVLFLAISFALGLMIRTIQRLWLPIPNQEARIRFQKPDIIQDAPGTVKEDAEDSNSIRTLDLNTATAEAFQTLPGIGPVTAGRIVDYRASNGPFESIEALTEVKGIGKKTLEKLKPNLIIESNNKD